ncbi:hypothetical protein JKP88DRAFT_276666 [Tribonema minus]|uniref:Uncharacterized protein n=1 Tax=Tribonema minus TaxID=303371 RepID=A0A835Z0Z0_9STRA|nr:hypothetical protein JKP88DRAFT_276666 [Tribonema minus]
MTAARTYVAVCDYLSEREYARRPFIDLPQFLARLEAKNFTGTAVMLNQDMEAALHEPPVPPDAYAGKPFALQYLDFGAFLVGHDCNSRGGACGEGTGHTCLPGPPDDGAKMLHYRLYG